ncbi:MAG TPA: hypothetical protein VF459_12585 [Caulobacteraceae bacterium]
MDYRAPSDHLGRRLSYSPVRPTVSRSWRLAIDDEASLPDASTPTTPRPSPGDELRRLYKRGGRFSVGLIEMRRRFGGDLDQYLIYMIVMLAELAHQRAAPPPAGALAPPHGLNPFSIAEITCIPRETVRRKLRIMIGAGHIRRGDDGLYYPGPDANLERFSGELNALL